MNCRLRYGVILGLALAAVIGSTPATAQVAASSLSGYVTDPSGAAIPGASVTITNVGTNVVRHLKTDSAGRYTAEALEVGTYSVAVQAAGFNTTRRSGVVLTVGEQASLNFKLEVGSTRTSVSVVGDVTHLQTESGQVSYLVSGKVIQKIAVNGRTFVSLATLVPGASSNLPDEPSVGNRGRDEISFNGVSPIMNVWYIDGAFNNDTAQGAFTLLTWPSLEALSEFRIMTNNYSAEYGDAAGAVVNMAIKSGTNDWHGGAYEFLRNDIFDARNVFLPKRGALKQHDFGFTLGGPVRRNKDFFFFSEELRRYRQDVAITTHTPSILERQGNFSQSPIAGGKTTLKDPTGHGCVTGTQIGAGCFDPNTLKILESGVFPVPNQPGFLNYTDAAPNPVNFHEEIARVDHHINENNMLFVHYIHEGFNQITPTTQYGVETFPTIPSSQNTPANNVALGFTQIVHPNLIQQITLAYEGEVINTKNLGTLYQLPSGLNTFQIFPQPSLSVIPTIELGQGYGNLDAGPNPWFSAEAVYTASDNLTYIRGRHTVKFGGMFQYQVKDQPSMGRPFIQGLFNFNGSFTGNSLADFLLGRPASFGQLNEELMGRYRYHQLEGYFEDDLKASRRLTLNLGVRYFFLPPAYETANQIVAFVPSRYHPAEAPQLNAQGLIIPNTGNLTNGIVLAGQGGIGRGVAETQYDDLAPRLGFAWQPWGTGKTVIRGGYGINYQRPPIGQLFNIINDYPLSSTETFNNPPFARAASASASLQAPPSLTILAPSGYVPYQIQQYSLGVQRSLPRNSVLDISYVGSHGTFLPFTAEINQPLPVPGFQFDPALNKTPAPPTDLYRPYIGFSSINSQETGANSTYNSLQASLQIPTSSHLHLQVAYTYSKAMDEADPVGGAIQNAYDLAANWGPAGFDRTHILRVNYVYDLPFFPGARGLKGELLSGWQIAGLTTAESGEPLNIGLTGPGLGLATRPNHTGPLSYPGTAGEWFDTSVFKAPPTGFFGNAERDLARGPGFFDWDISLYKNFLVHERVNAEFRWEVFNAFNQVNYMAVSNALGSGSFGQVTSAHDPRVMQLGLRLTF